ncbi:GAF domain-containing protein [Candidatus Binatia bacterium]|nr:GAF domain-containing protein [Candidatus Binatia bacterium]
MDRPLDAVPGWPRSTADGGTGLLARRLRTGGCIVLLAMLAFLWTDLMHLGHGIAWLVAIKVVQVAIMGSVVRLSSRGYDAARLGWSGAVLIGAMYLTTVGSALVRGEVLAIVVLLLAVAMATATYVPWGGGPQLLTVLCAAITIAGAVHFVPVQAALQPVYLWVAVAVVLPGSVWIAREHERQRTDRRLAEERLALESRVAAALARVGEEMIRIESTAGVLGQLCSLVAELLSCDETALTLYDPGEDVFAVQASFGHRPADLPLVEALRIPARTLQPLLVRIAREGVVELDERAPHPALLRELRGARPGNPRSVFAPLRRGGEVIGIISAHYRDGTQPFSGAQKRILLGTAQLASLALQNVRLLDELREANRVKSDFVSTMSHELRTPVSVILGYTEMLADSDDPSERAEILARVRRSGLELLELVEDTLSLSRLEAGGDPPVIEPVDVALLFTELADEFAAVTSLEQVALRWEGPATLVVRTDRRKLRTILKNLVGNALKFTVRGEVVLSCARAAVPPPPDRATGVPLEPDGATGVPIASDHATGVPSARDRDGDVVRFVVRDTGIGIAPQHLPIIFDMFRQADSSDARSYRGAGLGLHIVQRLVRQLGGEIAVTSEVGRGSAFTFTLPAAAVRTASSHGSAEQSTAA